MVVITRLGRSLNLRLDMVVICVSRYAGVEGNSEWVLTSFDHVNRYFACRVNGNTKQVGETPSTPITHRCHILT